MYYFVRVPHGRAKWRENGTQKGVISHGGGKTEPREVSFHTAVAKKGTGGSFHTAVANTGHLVAPDCTCGSANN